MDLVVFFVKYNFERNLKYITFDLKHPHYDFIIDISYYHYYDFVDSWSNYKDIKNFDFIFKNPDIYTRNKHWIVLMSFVTTELL